MIKIWHNGGWKWGGAGGRLRRWRIVRDLRNMTSVFHMEKAPKSLLLTLFNGSNEIQKKESRVEDSWWWRGGEGNLQSNTATYLAFWASPSWCWGLPASLGSLRLWEGNKRKRKSKNVDFGWKKINHSSTPQWKRVYLSRPLPQSIPQRQQSLRPWWRCTPAPPDCTLSVVCSLEIK